MPLLRLSAMDQSAPRSYHRFALVFACEPFASAAAEKWLRRAVEKTVSELPVLAGMARVDGTAAIEVSTSLAQRAGVAATMTWSQETGLSISDLAEENFSPRLLHDEDLTPLPDAADDGTCPVFAVQGTFIPRGLIVAIYLHRSVADIQGIKSVLRAMSEDIPTRKQSALELEAEVDSASLARSRLASGTGAPAFLAKARMIYQHQHQHQHQHQQMQQQQLMPATATNPPSQAAGAALLGFDLQDVEAITQCINTRRYMRRSNNGEAPLTTHDILLSLVWRMVTRAKHPSTHGYPIGATTSLSFPIDVRNVMNPPLEKDFLGNATITAYANHDIDDLAKFYDISNVERTATIISAARAHASANLLVRSHINMLADELADKAAERPTDPAFNADLKITDWSDSLPDLRLSLTKVDLGLDLGEPICIRKIGRVIEKDEAVVLPKGNAWWEVQIGLEQGLLDRLAKDDDLSRLTSVDAW